VSRGVFLILSGLFLVGLSAGLITASLSSQVAKHKAPRDNDPTSHDGLDEGLLPWKALEKPAAEIARVSRVVHAESTTPVEKLQALAQMVEDPVEADVTRALAAVAEGVLHLEAKRWADAESRLTSPLISASSIQPYALYVLGRALTDSKPIRAREVLERLERDLAGGSSFALVDEARLRLGRLLVSEDRNEQAELLFQKVLDEGRSESRGTALSELSGVLVDLGKNKEAVQWLEELYYEMPKHRLSSDAGRKLRQLKAHRPSRNIEELYHLAFARAELLFAEGRFKNAYSDYTALLKSYPKQVDREYVNLRRGVCQYRRRQSRSAEATLGRVKREDLLAEATLYRGEAARRLRKRKTYKKRLDEVLALDPKGRWAEEALWSLARYNVVEDDMVQALHYYERLAREFPEGEYYVDAQWRLLWDQYRRGRYAEAAKGFELTAREHPQADELSRFLYWGARAYRSSGRPDRAEALYRQILLGYKNTYYGRQAAEHLARLRGKSAASQAVENGREDVDLARGFQVLRTDRLEIIGQLVAVGLYDEAEIEAKRAIDGHRDDPAFMAVQAWLHYAQDDFRNAIVTIRRAFPFHVSATGDLLPEPVWRMLYPVKYFELVEQYAKDHGVDPYVVVGLIRQESTFNPRARSRVGARGLMQIMPYTGRKLARAHRRRYRTQDLYNPEINIRYGTHYLKEVLDRFGGRLDYALASYNAGPHRVKAWTGMDVTLDSEEFIEEIPFTETRNYVKLVLRNEMLYRRLYAQTPAAIVD
jgi:soluble lytic murein transglycosylase